MNKLMLVFVFLAKIGEIKYGMLKIQIVSVHQILRNLNFNVYYSK